MSRGSHFIGGRWVSGRGPRFDSSDPSTGEVVWSGRAGTAPEMDAAVKAARTAFAAWASMGEEDRAVHLEAFGRELEGRRDKVAETISRETGKPLWESRGEVDAMVAKISLSRDARAERAAPRTQELPGAAGSLRFRPHGVLAVLGSFNLPGHLPNGHIVPALLAGNTVVFKPSEFTPWVGEEVIACWERAGLPPGVLNLLQGAAETGGTLTEHREIDGILFTGSYETGCMIHKALGGHPEKIVALEMGGNNPLVVWNAGDPDAVAVVTVLSAFLTAGQRCTCARRLVVPEGAAGDRVVESLAKAVGRIRVGRFSEEPEPFMGPVISPDAADRLLVSWDALARGGGQPIVPMRRLREHAAFLSPGLIDVTGVPGRPDEELFGPVLQVVRVPAFEDALVEANRTKFGLSAGILTEDRTLYERFARAVRAGVFAWNRPTTGASGRLPFGGVGASGNHRPSGYWTIDSCSYPVAALEVDALRLPDNVPPGVDFGQ